MELTEFSNTQVEGTINCNRDGLLYTSIPSNGFWSAEVDGEPAEIVLIGECMVGLKLSEGQHTVSFRYRNKAFRTGLLISLSCAAVFAGIILLDRYLRNRKGKYHQAQPSPGGAMVEIPEDADLQEVTANSEAQKVTANADAPETPADVQDAVTEVQEPEVPVRETVD